MIVNGGGGKHRKPETLHADWRFTKALGLTLSSMGVVGAIAFTVPKTTVAAVQADVEQPETEPAPPPELPYLVPPTRRLTAPVADVTPLRTFDAKGEAKTEVRTHRDSDRRDKPKDHERARDERHDNDHRDGGRHRADHQRRAYEGHGRWPVGGRHHRDDRDHDRDRGHRGDRDQRGHGHGDRSGGHHRGGDGGRSHSGHGGGHGGDHNGRG